MSGVECLPLREIGGALAVCSHHGDVLGATTAASHLFARLGIVGPRLPDSLWRPLIVAEQGEAMEWEPRNGAVGTLGCTRYSLGKERHVLVMREISQLQREESQRLHQHRVEAAGRLVALVAHDLRAPLATLTFTVDVLRSRWADLSAGDIEESLEGGWQAIEQLTTTVDALLDFARVGPASNAAVPLRDVFDRVGAMLRSILREGRHCLIVRIDEQAACVRGNPVAIEQIFVNLVLNAAEAAEAPIEIRVDTAPVTLTGDDGAGHAMVRVRVADSGPGIAPEIRPRLFQGRVSTKGGTGIGLCLARDAALGGGGRLELEDSLHGTSFAVLLPAGEGP